VHRSGGAEVVRSHVKRGRRRSSRWVVAHRLWHKGWTLRASSTAPGPRSDGLLTGHLRGRGRAPGHLVVILLPSLLPCSLCGAGTGSSAATRSATLRRVAAAPTSPQRPGLRAVAPVVVLAWGLPGGGPAPLPFLRTSRPPKTPGAHSPAPCVPGAHRPGRLAGLPGFDRFSARENPGAQDAIH
jgi:hypothetical protein